MYAIKFAIALIYCGYTETSASSFTILIGHTPPETELIRKAIHTLRPYLAELAEQSCEFWRSQMPDQAVISIDGSWNHRRHGTAEILDVICVQNKKIIDFDIRIRESTNIIGNTDVTSQAMEGESFYHLLPRLQEDQKIVELVKDGDIEIDSIIKRSQWDVSVTPDPNHFLKHFEKHFKKHVGDLFDQFRGICPFLHQHFTNILYTHPDVETRYEELDLLENTILHEPILLFGRSTELEPWKYANKPECQEMLHSFIDLCKRWAFHFVRGHTTNYNEAYHALKAIFVPKDFYFGNTTDVRLFASVLQYNDRNDWLFQLYDKLNFDAEDVHRLIQYRHERCGKDTPKGSKEYFLYKRARLNEQNEAEREQHALDELHHIPFHS